MRFPSPVEKEMLMSTLISPELAHLANRLPAITGDRPTGALHLGHYVGSLRSRVALQDTHDLVVLVADLQALTDHAGDPERVRRNILEVMKDYMAVGLDPQRTTFVLQSAVPELAELFQLLLNITNVRQLERNPTVRAEMQQKGFAESVPLPAGFLCYPVSQAADIIGLGSGCVPVGEDQLPMIELTNTLIDRLNQRLPEAPALPTCAALVSPVSRLPGVRGDAQAKMSKSLGNALALDASPEEIRAAVQGMYTDPQHLRITDPGQVEGNVVFTYLDAFDPDGARVEAFKAHYRQGGLGDMVLKRHLMGVLEEVIAPIRERRHALASQDDLLRDVLRDGTRRARHRAQEVLMSVRERLGVTDVLM